MKTLKFKTIEEFQDKITGFETTELADAIFEAIQRGMKNNNKKVSVCDVEIEEDDELFTLYSTAEDWPVALKGCLETFIINEEYEKCIVVQELKKDYEIKQLVGGFEKTNPKNKKKTTKKNSSSKD
jgi:tRNA threonylcarbamoyladenosine modification (KEOPS) complex  Pcc1 subunit